MLAGSPSAEAEATNPVEEQGQQWAQLVSRIREGDNSAMEELYAVFSKGIRFY